MEAPKAMEPTPAFMDLLRQLADEHNREVGMLNEEVARLRQICLEVTSSPAADARWRGGMEEDPIHHAFLLSTPPGYPRGILEKEKSDNGTSMFVNEADPVDLDWHQEEHFVNETPDEDALEAALDIALLSDEAVHAVVPPGAPAKLTLRRSTSKHEKPAGDSYDKLDSHDKLVHEAEPTKPGVNFELHSTSNAPVVLGCWATLIKAVQVKQAIAALPGLNDFWQELTDEQSGAASPGARQGLLQLDVIVARATTLQFGAAEIRNSTSPSMQLCSSMWFRRAWRKSILHPTSRQRICWDVLGIILLVHDLVFIPMQVFVNGTDGMPKEYENFLDVLDIVGASFWSIDILVSLRTGFYSAEGFVELRPWQAAKNYVKSWFPLDLIIVCMDWGSMFLGMSSAAGFMRLGKSISRFMRVVRLLRFLKLNRALKEIIERINSEYLLQVMGLMKTLVLIVIINHYIACAWYGLGNMGFTSRWPDKFLVNYPDSFAYAYTTSLHWSLTQFTPASMEVVPENSIERLFVIAVILVALVAFSSFVSSITTAMTHIRQINAQKMQLESKIRQFFSEHKISHAMASRVWHFLRRHRIGASRRLKESDIPALKMLPDRIKEDLRMEIYAPTLTMHPLFAEYGKREEYAMLKICNEGLLQKSLTVGEELWRDVDEVHEMLFVMYGGMVYHETLGVSTLKRGKSRMTSLDFGEDVLNPVELRVGSWACELTLWANKASLPGVFMTLADGCELILLNADKFRTIVGIFQDSTGFMAKYATVFMDDFKSVSTECQVDGYLSDRDILFNSFDKVEDFTNLACGRNRGRFSNSQRGTGGFMSRVSIRQTGDTSDRVTPHSAPNTSL